MILNGLPWKWIEIILSFLNLHPSTAFRTLLADYEGYSISSKGFLPTVVDIMVIWVNLPIPVHFYSLIPKMLMFTLTISCLTTSNLPWFMDLTFQVTMQYCSLQHRTLLPSPVTSTTGLLLLLWLNLFILYGIIWSPVAYWALASLGSSSFIVLSFCLFIPFMGFSKQEYWSGFPFPSLVDHILSELSIKTQFSP